MPTINTEPVAVAAAIEATLALAIGFGLGVTPEQFALIMSTVTALLALVVRGRVTPS